MKITFLEGKGHHPTYSSIHPPIQPECSSIHPSNRLASHPLSHPYILSVHLSIQSSIHPPTHSLTHPSIHFSKVYSDQVPSTARVGFEGAEVFRHPLFQNQA